MRNLLLSLFTLLTLSVSAQTDTLKWFCINQYYLPNQNITVPVKTSNFSSISSFQYGVHYDTSYLKLDSITLYNALPGYTLENFAFEWQSPLIAPGNWTTLWTTPYANTLPNGTQMYKLHFSTKLKGDLKTTLFPSEEELVYEAIDSSFNFLPEIFFVDAEEQVSVNDPDKGNLKIYPTVGSIFTIEATEPTTILISDITGISSTLKIPQGITYLPLDHGFYFITDIKSKNVPYFKIRSLK